MSQKEVIHFSQRCIVGMGLMSYSPIEKKKPKCEKNTSFRVQGKEILPKKNYSVLLLFLFMLAIRDADPVL